jgi:hypothetical protein
LAANLLSPLLESEVKNMKLGALKFALLGPALVFFAWGQSGPAHDIGSGAADIGKAPAKATGSAAKGTAMGAADAVTLHPVGAVKSVGSGAVGAGRDVTVGAAKGTGKVARGVGKAFKKML